MHHTVLVVPGLHGSGADHWQSWLEIQLPHTRRIANVDWEAPILARWAGQVRREIDQATGLVWLVAHSYGCLASVVAAADRVHRVAGAMLVAPADPERFSPIGLRANDDRSAESVSPSLPKYNFGFPSVVVASSSDPWVRLTTAAYWADRWGSHLVDVGSAGHINSESGYGPWPQGLALLRALMTAGEGLPLGALDETNQRMSEGRIRTLARLRHRTRRHLDTLRIAPPDKSTFGAR